MAAPNRKLEAARMQKRWNIAVASEKVGVSINSFNRWERGLQVPQLSTLDQLCKAFELSPEELGFEDVVTPKRRTPVPSQELVSSALTIPSSLPKLPVTSTVPIESGEARIASGATKQYDVQICVEQAKRSLDQMSQQYEDKDRKEEENGISRRNAITAVISAPAVVLGLRPNQRATLLHPDEVLSLCSVSVPLSWELYFEGGLVEVENILPGYLAQLHSLIKQCPFYFKRTSSLLSQVYQLSSLLALQRQNFGTARKYAVQAFEFGRQAEDPNLQTASLIRLAQVYLYLKRPTQRLQAYEQALQYCQTVSPLMEGRVYIGLTEVHSCLGHEPEAQQFLAHAHHVYPAECKSDPNFSYTHFNHWSLSSLEGLMYLNLEQPDRAWMLFNQVDKIVPDGLVPNRIELMVRQCSASYALGDREQACTYLKKALSGAKAAGNQLRCDEAGAIYENICIKWGHDHYVVALEAFFADMFSNAHAVM